MAITIPDCFAKESEEYMTIPAMKRFCDVNNIKQGLLREDLFKNIIEFAEQNDENFNIFNSWLNKVLKEGIKHIYLREVVFDDTAVEAGLKDVNMVNTTLDHLFPGCPKNSMWCCIPSADMSLQNFRAEIIDGCVKTLCFEFAIRLTQVNSKLDKQTITYPIYVDIDLTYGLILGRAKSKNKIFRYTEDLSTEDAYKKTTEALIVQATKIIITALKCSYASNDMSNSFLKGKVYELFSLSTFTPKFISDQVNGYASELDDFMNQVRSNFNISDIYHSKMKEDLDIFIEKYLSLTQLTREHLQTDRNFYPIKTASTDEERTKHSTTSANYEPLQCKEKFFDTKKSITSAGKCDAVSFCHDRQNKKYFGSEPFIISFNVVKGWCIMKLPRYVEEEDVQYVLSRFSNS